MLHAAGCQQIGDLLTKLGIPIQDRTAVVDRHCRGLLWQLFLIYVENHPEDLDGLPVESGRSLLPVLPGQGDLAEYILGTEWLH